MGYTICKGNYMRPHPQTRACDGCGDCAFCHGTVPQDLWCWKCCGKLTACPECVGDLAAHVVGQGAPGEGFQFAEALAGYRAALSITRRGTPWTVQEALNRYPVLISHMICHSLGYMTPQGAAQALLSYLQGRTHYSEWYLHMARGVDRNLLEVGRRVVEDSFRFRHSHRGMMAHYPHARVLVEHVRRGADGPLFASWL